MEGRWEAKGRRVSETLDGPACVVGRARDSVQANVGAEGSSGGTYAVCNFAEGYTWGEARVEERQAAVATGKTTRCSPMSPFDRAPAPHPTVPRHFTLPWLPPLTRLPSAHPSEKPAYIVTQEKGRADPAR